MLQGAPHCAGGLGWFGAGSVKPGNGFLFPLVSESAAAPPRPRAPSLPSGHLSHAALSCCRSGSAASAPMALQMGAVSVRCSAPSIFLLPCSSSMLGAASLLSCALCACPIPRRGTWRDAEAPAPAGGFMPRFPHHTFLAGSCSRRKVRAEPAAPAAHPSSAVWVGPHPHPEPPLHFQTRLHRGYKRNSSPLREQPWPRGST